MEEQATDRRPKARQPASQIAMNDLGRTGDSISFVKGGHCADHTMVYEDIFDGDPASCLNAEDSTARCHARASLKLDESVGKGASGSHPRFSYTSPQLLGST
jgi:hypothetical protein